METKGTPMTIEQEYIATRKKSQQLYQRAVKVLPSGIVHDSRYFKPFPFYVERAGGARKWDVDGHELIDLCCGHGALILGHNHPAVIAAVREQTEKGFHYSACHELEVQLSEMITRLVPCAEKVRYIQSGTEACMLAVRLARAYTGKNKVIKFRGHFHGFWNELSLAVRPPFDVPQSIGVTKDSFNDILLVDHNDSDSVRRFIEETNDVAGVIMNPDSAHTTIMPNRPGFLEEVRQITKKNGVVLIFDEVVAGFRYAPGGAQQALGVTPDLTCLAKAVGGGLPLSAVAGKAEIMDLIAFTGDAKRDRFQRVNSQGTHSGNALSMAAGLATLKILSTGEPQNYINKLGAVLRENMDEVVKRHGIPGCVYGWFSNLRIFLGHDCPHIGRCDLTHCLFPDHERLDRGTAREVAGPLHLAMILNGVDLMGMVGHLNAAMTDEDARKVTESFDRSLQRLKQERIL